MNKHGFTVIELMIAMVLLLMAFSGISLVYITADRMRDSGILGISLELLGIQRKSQSPEEFLSWNFKAAKWAGIQDSGDRIEIDIPLDSSGENILRSGFYFTEYDEEDDVSLGSIFYDPNTSAEDDEVELYRYIYKIYEEGQYQPVFSTEQDLSRVVRVYFGYFKGDTPLEENRRKVEFKAKMRNVI